MAAPDESTERAWADWLARHRAGLFQRWIRTGDVVVEFGARDPWTLTSLEAARKHAWKPRGDPSSFSREQITVHAERPELLESSADVVICDGVLEYLLAPAEALLEQMRLLKPGGTLVVHALYDPAFRRNPLRETGDHYFSWNVQTLGNLLVDCGLELLEGRILRLPREHVVRQRAKSVGFSIAEWSSRLLDPSERVCVAARNTTQADS